MIVPMIPQPRGIQRRQPKPLLQILFEKTLQLRIRCARCRQRNKSATRQPYQDRENPFHPCSQLCPPHVARTTRKFTQHRSNYHRAPGEFRERSKKARLTTHRFVISSENGETIFHLFLDCCCRPWNS